MRLKKKPRQALAYNRLEHYVNRQTIKNSAPIEQDYKMIQHHADGKIIMTLRDENFIPKLNVNCSEISVKSSII